LAQGRVWAEGQVHMLCVIAAERDLPDFGAEKRLTGHL